MELEQVDGESMAYLRWLEPLTSVAAAVVVALALGTVNSTDAGDNGDMGDSGEDDPNGNGNGDVEVDGVDRPLRMHDVACEFTVCE